MANSMIFKAAKIAFLLFSIYITVVCLGKVINLSSLPPTNNQLFYNKQVLTLSSQWTDEQFSHHANNKHKALPFQINK
jgi:hypothetical protein